MGRRAKKAPVVTKKRPKLAKRFKCPFCANEDSVECSMDRRASLGSLKCRLCGAGFQMPINHLHEPIDVFSEWLDECEAAANPVSASAAAAAGGGGVDDLEEDDDPVPTGMPARSQKPAAAAATPVYQDLGLGDSEDDEDDE